MQGTDQHVFQNYSYGMLGATEMKSQGNGEDYIAQIVMFRSARQTSFG